MNGTSAPYSRAAAAISSSSVETIVRVIVAASSAVAIVCATSGLPASGRTFLRGRPFEPPRAGMSARTSTSDMGDHLARLQLAEHRKCDAQAVDAGREVDHRPLLPTHAREKVA